MRRRNWRKPIGEILIEKGLLTNEQLDEGLALQKRQPGKKIGAVLVSLGFVSMRDVLRAHAEQLGLIYDSGPDTD